MSPRSKKKLRKWAAKWLPIWKQFWWAKGMTDEELVARALRR